MVMFDRIADLTVEAQAAEAVGLDYARVQQLEAMREAARNEGGGAGLGMGLGAGMGMGQCMAQTMGSNFATPKAKEIAGDSMHKLAQLKKMFQAELISEEEYVAKKKQILDTL